MIRHTVTVLRRVDFLALSASVLSILEMVLYVFLTLTEDATPTWWALAVLAVGIVGSAYAVRMEAPYRRVALVVAAVALLPLGYLALLSIGLPLLLAGAFCVAAAMRARPVKDWRDMV